MYCNCCVLFCALLPIAVKYPLKYIANGANCLIVYTNIYNYQKGYIPVPLVW